MGRVHDYPANAEGKIDIGVTNSSSRYLLSSLATAYHDIAPPAHQENVANVDFWIGEAQHCLAVIDGYQDRFNRLQDSQAKYEKQFAVGALAPPLRRSAKDHTRQELRRRLCDAIESFLNRCDREKLLPEGKLASALA